MTKQYFIFIIILMIIIFAGGKIFEYAVHKFDPNESKLQEVLNLKNNSFDLVFMGNSITQQGINPLVADSLLGTNSYNLALGGASIIENEMLLRDYLLQNEKPKVVIYGLFVNERKDGDRLRYTIWKRLNKQVRNSYNDYLKKNDIAQRNVFIDYNEIAIFRYRTVIEHVLKYIVDPKNRKYKRYKGFLIATVKNKIPKKLNKHNSGINTKSLKSFNYFCNQEAIKVFYIELPNSESYNKSTLKREQTINSINSVIGDSLLSFNKDLIIYSSDNWVGLNHLNIDGANKFTSLLLNEIGEDIKNVIKD